MACLFAIVKMVVFHFICGQSTAVEAEGFYSIGKILFVPWKAI